MKKILIYFLILCFTVCQSGTAFSKKNEVEDPLDVQTLSNQITATVYKVKKTRYYTAVEIGFNNPTNKYLEFTPKEIYLDDAVKYSLAPLSSDQLASIEQKNPGIAIVPGALALGLGVASLGTAIAGKGNVARGLGIGALGAGGGYLITKGIENHTQQNRLIKFENNSLESIKRLPPGMTLGGFLYFPATKKPSSVTIVARSENGQYEKKVFPITK